MSATIRTQADGNDQQHPPGNAPAVALAIGGYRLHAADGQNRHGVDQ